MQRRPGISVIISRSTFQKKKNQGKEAQLECEGSRARKKVWHSNSGSVMFYFTRIDGDEICMRQLEAEPRSPEPAGSPPISSTSETSG